MLFRKEFEVELRPLYEKIAYGTTIWSPLASGTLTGKYNDGNIPEGSRLAPGKLDKEDLEEIYNDYIGSNPPEFFNKMKILGDLAKELKCTQAQLSIAWCIVNQDVSTCILGASKESQVKENLGALEVAKNWTMETEAKVEAIIKNEPTPSFNWRDWKFFEPRRKIRLQLKK